MVDISVLKGAGVTSDRLKEIFSTTGSKSKDMATQTRIKNRIRNRIQAGMQYNFTNYRYWHACDMAWDIPFKQTTFSFVRGLLDSSTPTKDILSALGSADISEMLQVYDKAGKIVSGPIKPGDVSEVKVHAPTFFQIFIPLAKHYTTIRTAAIVNSYRQVPLLKYEAAKSTKANRAKSDIITDRVEFMSTQYGYYDVIKQSVLQMLHYSFAIMFPAEEWDSEIQKLRVPNDKDSTKVETKSITVKEGLRYNIPHPSRVYIDTAHRPSTINSDTGVKFGGYWSVVRVGEVMNNKSYWNNEKIPDSGTDYKARNPTFFNTVYSSCALKFSPTDTTDKGDRETRTSWYNTNEPDRAITLSEYFEKVNPKDEDIGDYDGPVWFRYVVAGDDTVLYAAPLPYNPMVYFGYDALETRAQNASMTLEILPFQDHIANLFTQYILTAKQNLSNLTFVDTNQVDGKVLEQIKNLGHQHYTANNYIPMDMRVNRIGGNDVAKAFQTVSFQHQPTDELLTGIRELLNILERILVISPQELAQTASHELTAEEVRNMNAGKSTRYEFTAGAVDRAVWAFKKQLYEGLMAYGDEDIWARLPTPIDSEALTALGFTVEHTDTHSRTALVKGGKTALFVESFAANRDGDLRVANSESAQAMTQVLQAVTANPALFAELGAPQIINLMNEISQIAGLPRDFRFSPTGAGQLQQQQQMQALTEQLKKLSEQIEQGAAKEATQEVAQELQPVLSGIQKKFAQLQDEIQQIAQALTQSAQPPTPPPNASPYPQTPDNVAPVNAPQPMAQPPGMPGLPQAAPV